MDSINEKSNIDSFPFDSLRRFRNFVTPNIEKSSNFTAQSYDNRGRISDVASALRSKLGLFQTRMSSSSFLSDTFSWQVRTASTSDSGKLLAKALPAASEKTYSLEVDTIASARTAVSDRLVSDDRTSFDEGTYTYDVTVDDDTHSVEVVIEKNGGVLPTNRSVLLDIERSINKLGLDISATLHDISQPDYNPYRENAYKDMSYVSIASNDTGESIDFSIADTSGTLIETLNLDRVRQQGFQNQYRIDGDQGNSDSNNIVVESAKVSAYLLSTTRTGENLQISVTPGTQSLALGLEQIIGDYNELIQWLDDNDSVISPSLKTALYKELGSITLGNDTLKRSSAANGSVSTGFESIVSSDDDNSVDSDLAQIGLTLNDDGTLEIGEDFKTSVSSDLRGVWDALAGSTGFFTKISQAIDGIYEKNEAGYVYSRNSILSYNTDTGSANAIYQRNHSSLINLFA